MTVPGLGAADKDACSSREAPSSPRGANRSRDGTALAAQRGRNQPFSSCLAITMRWIWFVPS
jgi:hypothetical protein